MRLTVLSVPAADADAASDRLWLAGGRAVEEITTPGGVELRTVLAADDATSRSRVGEIPDRWTLRFVDVAEAPSTAWRDHVAPIDVNDELTLLPAWLARDELDACGRTVVEIEPAGSFGLGDHPTTRLSAAAVWRLVRPSDRVLDVGCGSGVLSIVAARRGARAVVAIDVAEAAYEATIANAERNGVGGVVTAAVAPLADHDGTYDVVAANILAPTLVSLADDLRRLTAGEGRVVISGVLAEAHDHVLDALAPMEVVRTETLDGWAAVELRHPL